MFEKIAVGVFLATLTLGGCNHATLVAQKIADIGPLTKPFIWPLSGPKYYDQGK